MSAGFTLMFLKKIQINTIRGSKLSFMCLVERLRLTIFHCSVHVSSCSLFPKKSPATCVDFRRLNHRKQPRYDEEKICRLG